MTAVATLDLREYLKCLGGSDVLTFENEREAIDAANEIRKQRHEGVTISASYNKVYLKCSTSSAT